MAHGPQGVYSPLPQHLSDSDSEKELNMDPICPGYGNNMMQNGNIDNKPFRQNGHMHFGDHNEDILKIKRVRPKMSALRKTVFVSSILLCFLPIIIFLWVLPCSDTNTCPVKISNWKIMQEDIELKGKISLVHGVFKSNYNLAMLFRGSLNSKDIMNHGAISFMGNNGAVAWYFRQQDNPLAMNCMLLDVNGNGLQDCLLLDQKGLKAIDSVSGVVVWHVHSHEEGNTIAELSMPVKLIDLNNDNINEILTIYQGRNLLLVCGKTGKALTNIKLNNTDNCTDMYHLEADEAIITFLCKIRSKDWIYSVKITDILKSYHNSDFTVVPEPILLNKEEIFITGNRKLKINNTGKCPACQGSITLFDDKDKKIRTWPYPSSHVMKPKSFSFQPTQANIVSLKGHINGFILKIWKWPDNGTKQKISKASRIFKRNVLVENTTFYLNIVYERVVLITFNSTDVHVVNVSSNEVNQICIIEDKKDEDCQPDYEEQVSEEPYWKKEKESVIIADIDLDGNKELISYISSYVSSNDENSIDNWRLVSYLKVFRLEDELPKLYETK